ncbi:MAG: hypothetical protein ACETWE_12815 [Candidatus Bathyarchaeia archaeon]
MSKRKMTNLLKKLKEDILASGLPTEIQVSNMLRQDNWTAINQYAYIDERMGKMRTLDIQARKFLKGGRSCTLFIECKKATDHQWLFYTQTVLSASIDILLRAAESIALRRGGEIAGPFHSVHPVREGTKLGIINYIPFGKKDDFNEARNQILSAIESRKLTTNEQIIVYPVIVFDGDIYEIGIEGEDIELSEASYVTFLSSMISEVFPIFIDVVTLRHFPTYLEMLGRELGPARSIEELLEEIQKKGRAG